MSNSKVAKQAASIIYNIIFMERCLVVYDIMFVTRKPESAFCILLLKVWDEVTQFHTVHLRDFAIQPSSVQQTLSDVARSVYKRRLRQAIESRYLDRHVLSML